MYLMKNHYYYLKGLAEQAVNTFRIMKEEGLKPCKLALNSLINAFSEDRSDSEAFAVLQYMKDNVSKCQIFQLLMIIWYSIFNLEWSKSLLCTVFPLDFLWVQDIKPDVVTYTTLMKALIRVEKFEKVILTSLWLLVYSFNNWITNNLLCSVLIF